jgi:hypothetical protein
MLCYCCASTGHVCVLSTVVSRLSLTSFPWPCPPRCPTRHGSWMPSTTPCIWALTSSTSPSVGVWSPRVVWLCTRDKRRLVCAPDRGWRMTAHLPPPPPTFFGRLLLDTCLFKPPPPHTHTLVVTPGGIRWSRLPRPTICGQGVDGCFALVCVCVCVSVLALSREREALSRWWLYLRGGGLLHGPRT